MALQIIGNTILKFDQLDSTNETANELVNKKEVKEGTVILSEFQRQGKGQQGNYWESEAGKNLTISIILYPAFLPPEKQFMLTKVVSLAVQEFIQLIIPEADVKIKWPNDIYVRNRKVAGILINNAIQGNKLTYTVVGIGVNINQTQFMSNAPNPVSFYQISGIHHDMEYCQEVLYKTLNKWYATLKNQNFKLIDTNYINSLYQFGVFKKYVILKKNINAKIVGVSSYGKLLLENIHQKTFECDLKEVEFVIKY